MADMKQTIQSVSIDLFYRKGYFATSISDIAKGCGIQKASIYYHFSSKEELLFQIMHTTMTELLIHLEACLQGISNIERRFRAAISGHVQFHLNRQKETFVANSELRGLSPEHYQQIVAMRDEYERVFQALIADGKASGCFADVDVKILSYAILTLCTSGAFWFKSAGRLAVDEIAEIYEKFILNGLKTGNGLAGI